MMLITIYRRIMNLHADQSGTPLELVQFVLISNYSCCNHRQMSVKTKIESHIQKKLKKFCQYEKSLLRQKNFFCRYDRICLFFSIFKIVVVHYRQINLETTNVCS